MDLGQAITPAKTGVVLSEFPVNQFSEIVQALAKAVADKAAEYGLEVNGLVRGVLVELGKPETANGFSVVVGEAVLPGWGRETLTLSAGPPDRAGSPDAK